MTGQVRSASAIAPQGTRRRRPPFAATAGRSSQLRETLA